MKKNIKKGKRTILQYLLKLPSEQAEKAIKNGSENLQKDFKGNTIKDALMSAFVWSDSPEGGDYWNDFVNDKLF